MLVLLATLIPSRAHAASDDTPDAQMILDLDVLTQPQARDRHLMRKLSLFERLRMLEMFRMLDDAPTGRRDEHLARPARPPRRPRPRLPARRVRRGPRRCRPHLPALSRRLRP